jgi:5-formyltetrahydrofolate cyclo-ligase
MTDPRARTAETDAELDARKKALRRQAKQQRADAAAAEPEAGHELAKQLFAHVVFPQGCAVSAYWPMGDEIDPLPALRALAERGHPLGLPTMPGKARPLVFRSWQPGDRLADGGFGTRVPLEGAPEVIPQVLLVPLLAFDRAGYRLGYGGGFYDRTLEALRARDPDTYAVGVAYLAQEVEAVPRDAYDQRLDAVVTEQGPVQLTGQGEGA